MIKMILTYHIIAFVTAFAADMIIGDPVWMPHPATLISKMIGMVESRWNDGKATFSNRIAGILFVLNVILSTEIVVVAIMVFFYLRVPILAISVEALLTYFLFSAKALKDETNKVYDALSAINPKWAKGKKEKSLGPSRKQLSAISGLNCNGMSFETLIRESVYFIAKNISDKAIAPMLYTAFLGPIGGYLFYASEMMDTLVGHKDERFETFGWAAARLSDILNFIPVRISALIVWIASHFYGSDYNSKRGVKVLRDRSRELGRPNKGILLALVSGIIGIDTDDRQKDELYAMDVKMAQNLMVMSVLITFIILSAVLAAVLYRLGGGFTW